MNRTVQDLVLCRQKFLQQLRTTPVWQVRNLLRRKREQEKNRIDA